jgi:hypothetical protein
MSTRALRLRVGPILVVPGLLVLLAWLWLLTIDFAR